MSLDRSKQNQIVFGTTIAITWILFIFSLTYFVIPLSNDFKEHEELSYHREQGIITAEIIQNLKEDKEALRQIISEHGEQNLRMWMLERQLELLTGQSISVSTP